MSIKNYFTKKQNTYLKVLQLRYCGRDSIIHVRNRPYFHYGPFGRTKNKMEVVQTYKTSCRYVTLHRLVMVYFLWLYQLEVLCLIQVESSLGPPLQMAAQVRFDLEGQVTWCFEE